MTMSEPAPLRLLVPYDGSDLARRTIDIAALFPTASVTILRVETSEITIIPGTAIPVDDSTTSDLRDELDTLAEPLRAHGHQVTVSICAGDPAEEIIAAAAHADLTIMATRGRGAAGRMLFGSTTDRVTRHSETPILLIRDVPEADVQMPLRVVVPLDGSPLAERALGFAERLARSIGVPLHLVRAVDHDDVRESIRLTKGTDLAGATWDDAVRYTVERATTYLESIAAAIRERGIDVEVEVLQGAPGFVLVWNTSATDLVVMTSHGHHGFRRWLLGSVAEKLIREGTAPTLLVPTRSES